MRLSLSDSDNGLDLGKEAAHSFIDENYDEERTTRLSGSLKDTQRPRCHRDGYEDVSLKG